MELEIWDILPNEQLYTYSQSAQLEAQTGCIGHLRGYLDGGQSFITSWDDHNRTLKTQAFKDEFDDVIHMLRFHPDYDHILKDRIGPAKYCYSHPSCQMQDENSYGIRVDTQQYSYLCRLNPNPGEYNIYIYAYKKDWLDKHLLRAQNGIRFIDPHYKELFRIPDGGRIRIRRPDGSTSERVCRFIDEYHTEIGNSLYHICEFAEHMKKQGNTVEPADTPLLQNRKEARTYESAVR